MVYLSLGTNIGDKEANLNAAIKEIDRQIGNVKAQSAFIVTKPWGFESENNFLNACVEVETILKPMELLDRCQAIERSLGRMQKSKTVVNPDGTTTHFYHDRVIDIDILIYDDLVIQTPRLTIPHPLMHKRRFVLEPLAQIAYNLNIPGTTISAGDMLKALDAEV